MYYRFLKSTIDYRNWLIYRLSNLSIYITTEIRNWPSNWKFWLLIFEIFCYEFLKSTIDYRIWLSILEIGYRLSKLTLDYWNRLSNLSIPKIDYRNTKLTIDLKNSTVSLWNLLSIFIINYRFLESMIDDLKLGINIEFDLWLSIIVIKLWSIIAVRLGKFSILITNYCFRSPMMNYRQSKLKWRVAVCYVFLNELATFLFTEFYT